MSTLQMPSPSVVPLLQAGDRLSREEFERRYSAMPHVNKAELIEGIVHMPSPVRLDAHGEQHAQLIWWVVSYAMHTSRVRYADNSSVRLDDKNMPQPDLMLVDVSGFGQASISADGYVEGAPEFVAEVSSSTVSIDLHAKKRAYLSNGVREYLVWRVLDGAIDWFVARDGEFVSLPPEADGVVRSQVFPGLWLDTAALLRGDLAAVLTVLQTGLASPEHATFVERLSK